MSFVHPRCPVCLQHVDITTQRTIRRHRDSLDLDTCPGSGEPHHITAIVRHQPDGAATIRRATA